jgi:ABC-type transporter Mla MlaB component
MAELDRLKDLLLDEERQQRQSGLDALDEKLQSSLDNLPTALPELFRKAQHDERLAKALEKPLADTLMRLARNQKQLLVGLLFPIIGPVIRRSIAETLSQLVRDMNRALDHSVSPTGLRWRWESVRTGVPFAQVVMRHTLRYRIEHLLLVDNQGGLLLAHVANGDAQLSDSDAVAGMLSALQDFARDAVLAGSDEQLNEVAVGGMKLTIVRGALMHLAIAVRGEMSAEARQAADELVEKLHGAEVLGEENDALETRREEFKTDLQDWLIRYAQESSAKETPGQAKSSRIKWVGLALVLACLAWGVWRWQQHRALGDLAHRFEHALSESPGISADVELSDGVIEVSGSRDPLSKTPEAIAADLSIPAKQLSITPFDLRLSFAPELWAKRLNQSSRVPHSVAARVAGDAVHLRGEASRPQLDELRQQLAVWQEFVRIDISQLRVIDSDLLQSRGQLMRAMQAESLAIPLAATELEQWPRQLQMLTAQSQDQRVSLRLVVGGKLTPSERASVDQFVKKIQSTEVVLEVLFKPERAKLVSISGLELVARDRLNVGE